MYRRGSMIAQIGMCSILYIPPISCCPWSIFLASSIYIHSICI
jgi:hypothetical protein